MNRTGKKIPTLAIVAAKCRDCAFDPDAPGSFKKQIHVCPILDCALWTSRPVSEGSLAGRMTEEQGLSPRSVAALERAPWDRKVVREAGFGV